MSEAAVLKTDNSGSAQGSGPSGNRMKLHARVAVLKHVVTPLLQAMAEVKNANKETQKTHTVEEDAQTLGALVEGAMALSKATTENFNETGGAIEDSVRWMIVHSSTQTVAARYRATGTIAAAEEAVNIAKSTFEIKDKFQSQSIGQGESVPNTLGIFRAKMLEALVPVVNAVAQYSFGRAEHLLLAQVAERLLKTADQVTRSLAPAGCTPKDWRLLCWSVLLAGGYLYSDCHFAEADRLLYMDKEERDVYFKEHDNMPPLHFVWQSFDQRMAMLATLITYLDVPESARLDEQQME